MSVWVPPVAAKSTYAAALAGDYREAPLLINAVALLASASLACPRGDSTIENQWRNALLALVQAGLLTLDSDHKVTPEALGVVLPRMKASGLEHGEALAAWMRATTVAEAAPASVSVFTRFDVPMFTWRDGLQRQAVEWKRRPVMLRGGVCA